MFQNALMNLSVLYYGTIFLRAWREFASIACIIICGCCFDMVLGKIWLIISSTTMMNMNLNMTTLVYIYVRSLFYWKNIFYFGNSISHYKLPFPLSLAFMCWCFQVMISGKKWDMNYWLCICQWLQLAIIFSHCMKIQLNCEFYFVRLLLRRIDALKQKAILQVSWMLWNYVDEWALSLFKDNLSALRNVDFGV